MILSSITVLLQSSLIQFSYKHLRQVSLLRSNNFNSLPLQTFIFAVMSLKYLIIHKKSFHIVIF